MPVPDGQCHPATSCLRAKARTDHAPTGPGQSPDSASTTRQSAAPTWPGPTDNCRPATRRDRCLDRCSEGVVRLLLRRASAVSFFEIGAPKSSGSLPRRHVTVNVRTYQEFSIAFQDIRSTYKKKQPSTRKNKTV